MDVEDVRLLFGGCEDLVQYYLGLRQAVGEAERDDLVMEGMWDDEADNPPSPSCVCDPRDQVMRERVRASGYSCVTSRRDVCDVDQDQDGPGYSSKQTALDPGGGDGQDSLPGGPELGDGCMDQEEDSLFECGHQGCTNKFSSLSAFESHYHSCHHYTCTTCRRVFVSSFMLDVHIEENHDSYFQVLCSKIDMYRCLVEGCEAKFRTPELRKKHLMSNHKYPANFCLHKPVFSGRPKSGGKPKSDPSDEDKMEYDGREDRGHMTRDSTASSQRAEQSHKVPSQICFGRGSRRAMPKRKLVKVVNNSSTRMEQR